MIKFLISHLFTPKVLQRQKRYLRRGLYKTRNTRIQYFIYHIDELVKYLKKFLPFGAEQRLPEDYILKLVGFSLPEVC